MADPRTDRIAQDAEDLRKASQRRGDVSHGWSYTFGIGGIVLAAITGASGPWSFVGDEGTLLLGVFTAILTAVATFVDAEPKALYHYAKVANYRRIALEARTLGDRTEPAPSEDEIKALIIRIEEIEGKPFRKADWQVPAETKAEFAGQRAS